jgi:nucleoside-diphosphate-sugar epimerase
MQQILVTGADGFIGSHLAEMLLAEGYKCYSQKTITLVETIIYNNSLC